MLQIDFGVLQVPSTRVHTCLNDLHKAYRISDGGVPTGGSGVLSLMMSGLTHTCTYVLTLPPTDQLNLTTQAHQTAKVRRRVIQLHLDVNVHVANLRRRHG